ncbi:MAG: HEPN domain-containing protein [Candidatus Rokubacteria bacterium]|nr:HEPN domain-containing protein [Candidatus Rokubacteria bacterium]
MPNRLVWHLAFLNPDYTVTRYPDAANGVPYELYDEATARAKVKAAEEIARWVESLIRS